MVAIALHTGPHKLTSLGDGWYLLENESSTHFKCAFFQLHWIGAPPLPLGPYLSPDNASFRPPSEVKHIQTPRRTQTAPGQELRLR